MTTPYGYSDTTPIMMSQVDAEAGIAGPPATGYGGQPATGHGGQPATGYGGQPATGYGGQPATGFAGGSVWGQEPTANASFSSADLRAIHSKGDKSLILSIVSFIGCFLCCPGVSMLCHIPSMLFAAKSRVSAEKKDYYDSKLMLHWSYICTFAGCFLGWVLLAVCIFYLVVVAILIAGGTTASSR